MNRPRTDSRLSLPRTVGALLTLGLLVAPIVGALGHEEHALEGTALIHHEASHPRAAPHFEREEHRAAEECLVCVHAGQSYVGLPRLVSRPSDSRLAAPRPIATAFADRSHTSASPRAPPV